MVRYSKVCHGEMGRRRRRLLRIGNEVTTLTLNEASKYVSSDFLGRAVKTRKISIREAAATLDPPKGEGGGEKVERGSELTGDHTPSSWREAENIFPGFHPSNAAIYALRTSSSSTT